MKTFLRRLLFSITLIGSTNSFAEFVGISQSEFAPHYRRQQQSMWCWASSAEMVLSYQGVNLAQDQIVLRIQGIYSNSPGSATQMIQSTNSVEKDVAGKLAVVSGQYVQGAPFPNVLFNQLKQKRPVILTFQTGPTIGHAVVLTGIDVNRVGSGFLITKYYFFDPFSYSQILTPMGPNLIKNDSLVYQSAELTMTPNGLWMIGKGIVTGAIFMNGSTL